MLGYRNVLFMAPGASSPAATMKRVAELVDTATTPITLFGVIPEATGLQRLRERFRQLDEVVGAQREAEETRLRKAATRAGFEEIRVVVEVGNPVVSVVQRVVRDGHDLVVIALGDDEADHAAVVRRILRKCPAPVWLVRPTRARTRRILAAVDVQATAGDLNTSILRTAADLHRAGGGELHLLHAWELYGEETMRHSAFMQIPTEEIDAMVESEAAERAAATKALVQPAEFADLPWRIEIHKAHPTEALVDAVERLHITTLVMGTVARSGIPGLMIGNTAETVLDRVGCSVLAVKPSDFHTPIRVDEAAADGP